jgi:hypothetical protein
MSNERKRDSEGPQERWEWSVWFLVSLLFFGAQLLLPVERGLAITRLFGAPIYLPLIINFLGTMLISFWHPKRTVLKLSEPWVVLNLVFAIFAFFSSVISTTWEISLFYSYMWISNFVLCFLIVDLLFDKIKLRGLVLVICIVAVCQIAIGIMEGFFQTRFLLYELATLNYLTAMGAVVLGERGNSWDLRIMGTLGDAILFGTALMLSIPFLSKLNHKFIRFILICMALVVALMTLSRTVFVFGGCYLVFYLWNSSFSKKVAATVVVLAAFLLIANTDNPLSNNWSQRLEEEDAAAPDLSGVEMREDMAIEAIKESTVDSNLWEALCGHGFYSSKEIASNYLDVSTTIDNAYATVLYENGLIGAILYLVICLLPFRYISGRGDYLFVAGYVGILLCGFSFVTHKIFSTSLLMIAFVVVVRATGLRAQDPLLGAEKKAYQEATDMGCPPKDAFALDSQ